MRDMDVLRQFQAEPAPPTADAVAHAERKLRAEIGGRRPRRRRKLALGLIPVALVVAGAGYALHEPARVDVGPACGDEAEIWPANTTVIARGTVDPVEACAALWRQGVMDGVPRRVKAADLTPCVAPTGVVIVLPGGGPGFCELVGGTDLPDGYAARRERLSPLFAALDARFADDDPASACLADYAAAMAVARRILDAHGFTDWKVVRSDERFGPDRTCASASYDERAKTVTIGPV